jgi:hypothetical protein
MFPLLYQLICRWRLLLLLPLFTSVGAMAQVKAVVIPMGGDPMGGDAPNNLAPVGRTGQTLCYDTAGDPVTCAGTGLDGDLLKGVAWPNPRFTDNGNGTVSDNLTGLIWLKDAACTSFFTGDSTGQNDRPLAAALIAASSLANGHCGLSDGSTTGDWSLPTANELRSLVDFAYSGPALPDAVGTAQWTEGDSFSGVVNLFYWSSTTNASLLNFGWVLQGSVGNVRPDASKGAANYVWPVRGGQ